MYMRLNYCTVLLTYALLYTVYFSDVYNDKKVFMGGTKCCYLFSNVYRQIV